MTKIPKAENIEIKEVFENRYKGLLGKDYEQFLECSLSYLRKSIRVNTLKKSVEKVKKQLSEWRFEQIPWCKQGFWIEHEDGRTDIGNHIAHSLGYFYVQEAASMIPPVVLSPKPNEIVLDMCAAPGSKSTQMAQYMQNRGIIICNDNQASRLAPLSINLQRCGVRNSIVTLMHGSGFGKLHNMFDRVLVDAPCSGTGTIRKSIKTLEIYNPDMIRRLSITQKKLVRAGFSVLKNGGILVYSTCSLEPRENEEVVDYLLREFDNVQLEKIKLDINKSDSILEFDGKKYSSEINKTLRIWPHDNDTDGFFVAKIRKTT